MPDDQMANREKVWAWLRGMQKQGEDRVWRGADRAISYLGQLEAENERLSKAICSGVLGELLNDDEKDAMVDFIKVLRGEAS